MNPFTFHSFSPRLQTTTQFSWSNYFLMDKINSRPIYIPAEYPLLLMHRSVKWVSCRIKLCQPWEKPQLTQTIQQQTSSSSSSTPCSGLYSETSTACSPTLPDLSVILLTPSFDGVLNGPSLRDLIPLCHTALSQAGFSLAQSRWQIVIIISQSPKLSGVRAVWNLSLNVPSEQH